MTCCGVAGVIVRSFAIVGLGVIVGLGHSMTRSHPIRLAGSEAGASRHAAPATTPGDGDPGDTDPGTQPGMDTGSDTGGDTSSGTPVAPAGTPRVYDAGRVASLSGEALLDEPVLEGMITLREARDLFEGTPPALFIDARHEHEYEAGHIQGAVWMPAEEVSSRVEELLAYDPMAPVVIYCEGGSCDASHNTLNRLEIFGPSYGVDFARVEIMGLGYEEWKRAGLPTSEGGEP